MVDISTDFTNFVAQSQISDKLTELSQALIM